MNWYENQVLLTWFSIMLIVVASFLGLYFQSERFSRAIQYILLRIKLFISQKKKILFILLYILFSIYLLIINQIFLSIVFYALFITLLAYLEYRKKRNVEFIVSCLLGDTESEKGSDGLKYIPWSDGNAVKDIINGIYVRRTDVKNKQRYIYFTFGDNSDKFKNKEVFIVVEYYDNNSTGNFSLQYDSSDNDNPNKSFKSAIDEISFTGTNTWKMGIWKIYDGNFNKSQQSIADFRFRCGRISSFDQPSGNPGVFDIYIRKVIVISLPKS